jgi:predicted AAA+ superfamily ATPase
VHFPHEHSNEGRNFAWWEQFIQTYLERDNPKIGASWESFVIEELIGLSEARPESFAFYRSHAGGEVDLAWTQGGRWGQGEFSVR